MAHQRHSMIMGATTLVEMMAIRGESNPTDRWVTFLDSSGKESPLTYGELLEGSRRVASALKQLGIDKNQPVLIILPTSMEFLFVFWGVLLTGAIPVPLYPPVRMYEINQYASQLLAILKDCGASLIITSGVFRTLTKWIIKPVSNAVVLKTAHQLLASGNKLHGMNVGASEATALIQYTSGSTGRPKGADLTHANLLANIRAIARSLNYRETDVGVSWLPLYHDMGLIGAILSTIHFSIPLVLFSPLDFIRSPKRWLWVIHKYRGTLSAAPNFAYSLCTRKIKDRDLAGLDLSSWRVAINGAEQIHSGTLEQFVDRFSPYGFSSKAFLPAYGLAEATLAVTFAPLDDEPRIKSYDRKILEQEERAVPVSGTDPCAVRWVSVGTPLSDHQIRIVNPDHIEVPDRKVGEVIVLGPSVMKGYYRQPRVTAGALRNGWLSTGDLGFIDDGHLYITGRSKDLIIKGGKNYYPQDIEASADSVEGVRAGCVSAFGIPNLKLGTEEIIVVAETRIRSTQRCRVMMQEIKKKIHEDTGCSPDRVVLVPPGTVPKTSSGKIQRYLCRQRYLDGAMYPSKMRIVWQWIRLYLKSILFKG